MVGKYSIEPGTNFVLDLSDVPYYKGKEVIDYSSRMIVIVY